MLLTILAPLVLGDMPQVKETFIQDAYCPDVRPNWASVAEKEEMPDQACVYCRTTPLFPRSYFAKDGKSTKVSFKSRATKPVHLYGVELDGSEAFRGTIPPGSGVEIHTIQGGVLRVYNDDMTMILLEHRAGAIGEYFEDDEAKFLGIADVFEEVDPSGPEGTRDADVDYYVAPNVVETAFVNRVTHNLELYWTNGESRHELVKNMAPGELHAQNSYIHHEWVWKHPGTRTIMATATVGDLVIVDCTEENKEKIRIQRALADREKVLCGGMVEVPEADKQEQESLCKEIKISQRVDL